MPEDWGDTVPPISKIVVSVGRELVFGFVCSSREIVVTVLRQLQMIHMNIPSARRIESI